MRIKYQNIGSWSAGTSQLSGIHRVWVRGVLPVSGPVSECSLEKMETVSGSGYGLVLRPRCREDMDPDPDGASNIHLDYCESSMKPSLYEQALIVTFLNGSMKSSFIAVATIEKAGLP